MGAGGIEIRHQRRDESVVGLMRDGGGLCAVVVAGKHQHAAVLGRACRIAVAEDVAAAVDAGALAVPDADHAVILGTGRQIELLRAPNRGGRQILVHAGLELDVVLFEMLSRGEKLLVITAGRGAAEAGDEAGGVEAHRPVAADLRRRQANQRLNAGQETVAGALGVFLVETDRTLVDSHAALVCRRWCVPDSASHSSLLEPVYVGFFILCSTNLDRAAAPAKIAISCRESRQAIALCVAQRVLCETA